MSILSCLDNNAYFEIVVGPMFSGKTTRLIETYKKCQICNIPVVVINHSLDVRYSDNMLSSHDKNMIACWNVTSLDDVCNMTKIHNDYMICDKHEECNELHNCKLITDKYSIDLYESICKAKVILINEAQFFTNLKPNIGQLLRLNKHIYIYGLDGDFKRNKFGEILDLIPLCDKIVKLHALCLICKNGTPGIFSLRLSQEIDQVLIGFDNYIPVCRNCYEKH